MTISAQTLDEIQKLLVGHVLPHDRNAADADDIVQDTFVRALEKPPPDTEAPLRPWLVKCYHLNHVDFRYLD
jgi:DNA-directed RNA polymerase specialized sigma24 family protein